MTLTYFENVAAILSEIQTGWTDYTKAVAAGNEEDTRWAGPTLAVIERVVDGQMVTVEIRAVPLPEEAAKPTLTELAERYGVEVDSAWLARLATDQPELFTRLLDTANRVKPVE